MRATRQSHRRKKHNLKINMRLLCYLWWPVMTLDNGSLNMPEIIQVSNIAKYEGQEVTVQGWVYNRTDKGKLVFLLVRDGSGFVQCVAFKGDLDEGTFDQLMRIPQESSVIITGPVRADGRAPGIPG